MVPCPEARSHKQLEVSSVLLLRCAPVDEESKKELCDVLPGSEAASSPCFLLAVLLALQAGWVIPFLWTVGEEHLPLCGLSSKSSLASPQS